MFDEFFCEGPPSLVYQYIIIGYPEGFGFKGLLQENLYFIYFFFDSKLYKPCIIIYQGDSSNDHLYNRRFA